MTLGSTDEALDVAAARTPVDSLEKGVHAMLDALDRARAMARSRLGLSPLECLIVRALCKGPRSISSLSRHLAANRSSISMAAQRLEQRAMLTRRVTDRTTVLELGDEVRRQYVELGYAPIRIGLDRWLDSAAHQDERDERIDTASQLLHVLGEVFDHTREARRSLEASDELHDALRRGDVEQASAIVLTLVRDRHTVEACRAIANAMHRVGDAWERGEISIADERIASSTAERASERLRSIVRSSTRSPGRGKRALVCTGVGETHTLGVRLVMGELERAGWTVDLITGELPVAEVVELARRTGADAAFVGVTLDTHLAASAELIAALAAVTPVYVGGQAVGDDAGRAAARTAGATGTIELSDLAQLAA